ncbi:MAG: lipoyl synthase, partial [Campylobacterales bacterium]|nr:lipoyl synthase [Campylobacterales bacterium]
KITPAHLREVESMLQRGRLHTVCQEAMCPNIGECFAARQATFMILGNICTRGCTFCAVGRGQTLALDPDEPHHVAETVAQLGLRHVVITSVTRDDLPDGGADHFCQTVRAIKEMDEGIAVELLIPDMRAHLPSLERIARSGAEILGHNLETVPRLYHVRKGSDYRRSLEVLETLRRCNPSAATKSGIMLGLGEREEEVRVLMGDLLNAGCRLLSIGQYLSPSAHHAPVVEYVVPERFEFFRRLGMEMGFEHIQSSPYTRSSYRAHEYRGGHHERS